MTLGMKNVVGRRSELSAAVVEGGLVVLNLAENNYVALDSVGRRIWEILAVPTRIDLLCQTLGEEFQAGEEEIASDVLPFLERLVGEGLLRVSVR